MSVKGKSRVKAYYDSIKIHIDKKSDAEKVEWILDHIDKMRDEWKLKINRRAERDREIIIGLKSQIDYLRMKTKVYEDVLKNLKINIEV